MKVIWIVGGILLETVQIFIIHSERDNTILEKVVCEFNGRTFGRKTLKMFFLDSQNASQLGRNFGDIIEEEMDNSKYVITIVTANSERSIWVNQEIGYAKGIGKEILPMKEKSFSHKGLGFLHSNIDAQLFHVRQKNFPKLNKFFVDKFGEKAEKVVKEPYIANPIKETAMVPVRRVKPDVV